MSYYHRTFQKVVIGADGDPVSSFSQWLWPLLEINGNQPKISDGFGREKRIDPATKKPKGHFGADIMWARRAADSGVAEVKSREGKGAKGHIIYQNAPVIASGPGKVFSAENTGTGFAVKISHRVNGRPYLSVYRHLKNVLVKKGQIVPAGLPLGMPGDNPAAANDPVHLHFEMWDTSIGTAYPDWCIDPATVMSEWRVMRADGSITNFRGGRPLPESSPNDLVASNNISSPIIKRSTLGAASAAFMLSGVLLAGMLAFQKGGRV